MVNKRGVDNDKTYNSDAAVVRYNEMSPAECSSVRQSMTDDYGNYHSSDSVMYTVTGDDTTPDEPQPCSFETKYTMQGDAWSGKGHMKGRS